MSNPFKEDPWQQIVAIYAEKAFYDPWFFMLKISITDYDDDFYGTNLSSSAYFSQIFYGEDKDDGPWSQEWMDDFDDDSIDKVILVPQEEEWEEVTRQIQIEAYPALPQAWVFCEKYPNHPICNNNRPRNIAPHTEVSFHTWKDRILEVDMLVNSWGYEPDPPGQDIWELINGNPGDCENQALTKMQRLSNMGMPSSAMDLILCYLNTSQSEVSEADGINHALAVIFTDRGMIFMDNGYREHLLFRLPESTHSNISLFTRCRKNTAWGITDNMEKTEGEYSGLVFEETVDIPQDGIAELELELGSEPKRIMLLCEKIEDE